MGENDPFMPATMIIQVNTTKKVQVDAPSYDGRLANLEDCF